MAQHTMNSLHLHQFQPQLLAPDTSGLSSSDALSRTILSDTDKALLLQHTASHNSTSLLSVMPGQSYMGSSQLMPQLISGYTPHHPIT